MSKLNEGSERAGRLTSNNAIRYIKDVLYSTNKEINKEIHENIDPNHYKNAMEIAQYIINLEMPTQSDYNSEELWNTLGDEHRQQLEWPADIEEKYIERSRRRIANTYSSTNWYRKLFVV